MELSTPKIIVIVGPNASGKSELGIKIAKKFNGEIISADSRQAYRGLNIGSGKIIKKDMRGIPHHCLSIANPKKVFTALDFKKCAESAITDIFSRGKTPIIVGGTGFYIDAALGRMKLGGVPPNPKLRKSLEKKSTTELLKMLKKLDPKRAETIEQKNPRRLIRAIEIASARKSKGGSADSLFSLAPAASLKVAQRSSLASLEPARFARQTRSLALLPQRLSHKRRGLNFAGFASTQPRGPLGGREESKINTTALMWLGIKRQPEELKKRIHKRLIMRLPGIIREIKKLKRDGLSWHRLYDLGLEYRYVSLYLRGELSKDGMIQKILAESWHYAKRQMTWFKKNKGIKWISNPKSLPMRF